MEPLIRYPIFQHAWFVSDLEKTCLAWHRAVGAGPFFITENHVTETQTYRGQTFLTPLHYAFGYHGETQVQFIQQDEEAQHVIATGTQSSLQVRNRLQVCGDISFESCLLSRHETGNRGRKLSGSLSRRRANMTSVAFEGPG